MVYIYQLPQQSVTLFCTYGFYMIIRVNRDYFLNRH
jgi:hypothetical protein